MPLVFESSEKQRETLYNIIIILYELYCSQLIERKVVFSNRFLKFFKGFGLWSRESFLETFIDYMFYLLGSFNDFIFYSDIQMECGLKKKRIKGTVDVYKFVSFVTYYFLDLPFEFVMDCLNNINDKDKDISRTDLFESSKLLEKKIGLDIEGIKSFRESSNTIELKSKKIDFVLKRLVVYLDPKEDKISSLLLLNKDIRSKLFSTVYKSFLLCDDLSNQRRIFFWNQIALNSNQLNISILSKSQSVLSDKIKRVINMDVKRTRFIQPRNNDLETLLSELVLKYPNTSYYQGMNCIGGFLIKYTNDYESSKRIFAFIIRKRLELYFANNFARLKRLLYISERIIKIYLPLIDKNFESLRITTEFYISPFLLTVFTSSLQFIDNYKFVIKVFDMLIAEGWPGFFKVFIWVFKKLEERLLIKDYETLLQFLNKEIYKEIFYLNIMNLKTEIKAIDIDKRLIKSLEREYEETRQMVDEYWNEYYEKKKSVEIKTKIK